MHVEFLNLKPPMGVHKKLDEVYYAVRRSGEFLRGKYVTEFEELWAGYVGTRHCIAVQSGGEALRLLVHLWLRHGNWSVSVPWNSTPTIDSLYGTTPNLLPTGDDLNMSTNRCKYDSIFIPVHLYGNPCRMEQFEEGSTIFEDACQAHGARYKGKKCGTLAKAAAWSFYPTKNLGALGDAGAITTDDANLAAELRAMRCTRMDALQAGFLAAKLPYLDRWNATRREIAEMYRSRLRHVGFPAINEGAEPNWHLFVILYHNRARLAQDLKERGVETMVHYGVDERVLSLPCNPFMLPAEAEYVVEAVNSCTT